MRLIDGDALYKKLNDIRKQEVLLHGRSNNKYCCTLSTALFEIDCAPTIEPQRKKGEWIPQDHNKTTGYATTLVYYYPKCSECGHTGDFSMNFCPNCGSYNGGENDDKGE
jgi:ribosomal protein L32